MYRIATLLIACLCEVAPPTVNPRWPPVRPNDVDTAFAEVSTRFRISIIGELKQPIPDHIVLHGNPLSVEAAMNDLVSQCPGYVWHRKDSLIVFQKPSDRLSSSSPLNTRLRSYTIPSDWADFVLGFPNALKAAKEHLSGEGMVISGLATPARKDMHLQTTRLSNVLARDVLVEVSKQVRPIVAVVIISEHPDVSDDAWLIVAP